MGRKGSAHVSLKVLINRPINLYIRMGVTMSMNITISSSANNGVGMDISMEIGNSVSMSDISVFSVSVDVSF